MTIHGMYADLKKTILELVIVVLLVVVIVKLRTSPDTVFHTLQTIASDIRRNVITLDENQRMIIGLVRSETDKIQRLNESVVDRWRGADELKAWNQFFKANPNLAVPPNFTPFQSPANEPLLDE